MKYLLYNPYDNNPLSCRMRLICWRSIFFFLVADG